MGIKQLIVVINKMDDLSVCWAEERFSYIVEQLTPFLTESCKFSSDQISWIPVSGLYGDNLVESSGSLDWYMGPSFIELVDSLPEPRVKAKKPLRIPVVDCLRD
jgi:translation elongation factor EF-1alpha